MKKIEKWELELTEEQAKIFHWLTPYIEQAGYKWRAENAPHKLKIRVMVEPYSVDKKRQAE